MRLTSLEIEKAKEKKLGEVPRINGGRRIDWVKFSELYGGLTATEIEKKCGVTFSTLIKAHRRGDFVLKPGHKRINWDKINKMGKFHTIPEIERKTGISADYLRKAAKAGKFQNWIPCYKKRMVKDV